MAEASFKIDFIGIGASKCGTTWLGHVLEEHPQLCMSEPKEVHFFNEILSARSYMKPHFHLGLNWYKKFFKHCSPGKLIGEITPRYSRDPVAAQRIKEHNPDIKILYCLRSPVDRIWSHFLFSTYFVGKEDRPIMTAIKEEPDYIEMSRYHRNLQYYLELFRRDQILIIWFEDIVKRPEEILAQVYTFLGVDPDFRPSALHKKSNAARVSRNPKIQQWIRRINYVMIQIGFSGLIKKLKMAGMNQLVNNANTKPLEKKPVPEEVKNYVLNELKDDIHQLEKLLSKDLSHWMK